jgi:hypothetical protein
MAGVTGPLMSMDASGTVGKTITFGKWKGRHYVRARVIPNNPKSAGQLGVRSMFRFLATQWAVLSAPAKASYEAAALTKAISAFNQYVSENSLRWQAFTTPTQTTPAAEASTPLTITTAPLTGGIGQITMVITPSGGTAIWGYAIFRSTAEITTPSPANCVAVIEADGANAVTFLDSPLVAGTYHYRVCAFNTDGIKGTVLADASATAT